MHYAVSSLALAAVTGFADIPPDRATAQAAAGDTLRLATVVALARQANPMLHAARLRADAAARRVSQAGALPDPELSVALANRMIARPGSTADPMTMNELALAQMIPWPGKLGLAAERARHLADADALEADEAERMLVARVKALYYEIAYVDRAVAIMTSSQGLLRDFLRVSSAMYAVGNALQQDVLTAQVAVARMTEELTVMGEERVAHAARLNALIGREATELVVALETPVVGGELPGADSLMALAVAGRPALAAARARAAAAGAAYRAARRELYPDFMVGLSYGQRPAFDDMASVMIGIRVPVWAGARQLSMRREMAAMQAMAEAEARDLYNQTFAELVSLRAEAERSRRLVQLYATSILPQARASVEAALAAYRVGQLDYMNVIENQMTVNRYETESVRLSATYQRAVAEIEALVAADLRSQP